MGDYIREFSVSQFNKHHSTPKVFDGKKVKSPLTSQKAHQAGAYLRFL